MSIATAIQNAQGRVADCYTAISNKGGTLPATQNLSNMPTAIGSIPSGGSATIDSLTITPTTSQQTITASGGVDGYSPITVNAVTSSIDANITAGNIKKDVQILGVTGSYEGGGGGYTEIPSYQVTNGVASRRSGALTGNTFSGITSVGSDGLAYAFYFCSGLTGTLNLSSLTTVESSGLSSTFRSCTGLTGMLNLSSLTTVGSYGLDSTFRSCTGLTSVDLSALTSVGNFGLNYAFHGCSGLTGALNLSALTTVGSSGFYYAFQGCTKLTSVDLSSLTTVESSGLQYAFYFCTGLTSVDLSSLTSIEKLGLQYAFQGCYRLTDVYFNSLKTTSFGSYTNQFRYLLSSTGTSVTHTLHFPSNLESTIQGLTGYPTFGGTSGYVVLSFDLPATS